jgi:ferredoxin
MVEITIREEACRGCRMCTDVCPTEALLFDEPERLARVREARDCIACLSCSYLCPSGAITLKGFHAVKNFYRELAFSRRAGKFL